MMVGGMVPNNVLILPIGMPYRFMKNKIFIILGFLLISACRLPDNAGFYQPITARVTVPDGPPEYKAGWHAGCRSGFAAKIFANSWVYEREAGTADFGSGVYQHDKAFQVGYGQGIWACYGNMLTFTYHHSMKDAPLQ